MIDFRYHIASLVAVFLALAIGMVIGSTALRPAVQTGLQREIRRAVRANNALYSENKLLRQQVQADDAFGQSASGYLLAHLLQGEQVVLVTAPGADSATVTGITTALRQSGATVTGQVVLTPQFLDHSARTEQTLTGLAASLAPSGVTLPGQTPSGALSGQQAAAQVIAAALMTGDGPAAVTNAQRQAILTGFGRQGFLQASGPDNAAIPASLATLAVVVIPATPSASATSPANLALVAVAGDLKAAGKGAVLAGNLAGSGSGSAIDLVSSGGAGVTLPTVDNADSEIGQITVVWALRDLLNPHPASGNYGVNSGTVPSPAPSTSPTPSPSPTRSRKQRVHR